MRVTRGRTERPHGALLQADIGIRQQLYRIGGRLRSRYASIGGVTLAEKEVEKSTATITLDGEDAHSNTIYGNTVSLGADLKVTGTLKYHETDPTGMGFAEVGHKVICVDIDEEKVNIMKKGISPIYEDGLEELMQKNYSAGRIDYTTDYKSAYKDADANWDP
jgi:hypothetical protein